MGMQQEMHCESGLLRVDVRGVFSLEEAKRAFLEIIVAVARFQAEKVLVDGRKLNGNPKDFERFCYSEFAAKATNRLFKETRISPRFAYLINEPLLDPRRFGETVALNRGMKVKTFETLEEACEWLVLTPANKPDLGGT
jgi:hypothetical protein